MAPVDPPPDPAALLASVPWMEAERDRLRAEVAGLHEQLAEWQTATGLIGSGGDPSTITPDRLERYIARLNVAADAARRLLASDGQDDDYTWSAEREARAGLVAALAALPADEGPYTDPSSTQDTKHVAR